MEISDSKKEEKHKDELTDMHKIQADLFAK